MSFSGANGGYTDGALCSSPTNKSSGAFDGNDIMPGDHSGFPSWKTGDRKIDTPNEADAVIRATPDG